MDTIRYLLSVVLKFALVLFLLVIMLWFVGVFYPQFKISNLFGPNTFSADWLPAPKNYSGLLGTVKKDGQYGTVYVPNAPYNGYTNTTNGYSNGTDIQWTTYTATGTQTVHGNAQVTDQIYTGNTTAYSEKSLYIRNLSVYDGSNITYGTRFVGEARDTMFKNGTFTIAVIDRSGTIVGTTQAINTGTWAAPGWARFQATLQSRLPPGADCALVFFSAQQNIKVGIAVKCN